MDELLPSANAERNSQATNVAVRLVGFDQPFFTALALVASFVSAMFCWFTQHSETQRVYFTQRCEAYVEDLAFSKKPVTPSYLKDICQTREN